MLSQQEVENEYFRDFFFEIVLIPYWTEPAQYFPMQKSGSYSRNKSIYRIHREYMVHYIHLPDV